MGPGPWGAAARARALAVHQWGVGTVVPRALVYHPKPNGHFEGDQVPRGNGGQRLWSAPPPPATQEIQGSACKCMGRPAPCSQVLCPPPQVPPKVGKKPLVLGGLLQV